MKAGRKVTRQYLRFRFQHNQISSTISIAQHGSSCWPSQHVSSILPSAAHQPHISTGRRVQFFPVTATHQVHTCWNLSLASTGSSKIRDQTSSCKCDWDTTSILPQTRLLILSLLFPRCPDSWWHVISQPLAIHSLTLGTPCTIHPLFLARFPFMLYFPKLISQDILERW